MDRLFKIGVNERLRDKEPSNSPINFATDFKQKHLSVDQLIGHIRLGHGVSAHFKNAYRKTANFVCSDFVAADVDEDLTIHEALAQPFIQEFASFIHTTASHTSENPRFRVMFLLEDTITKSNEWGDCLFGLAIKLNSDRSIKDAARFFFGNSRAEFHMIGNLLPTREANKLIAVGAETRGRYKSNIGGQIPLASKTTIGDDQLVKLSSGEMYPLGKVPAGTNLYCPYHLDRRPSAFVVKSRRGEKGIHCMACNSTYWSKDGDDYDFDAFDQLVEDRHHIDEQRVIDSKSNSNFLARYFPPTPQITYHQSRYLPAIIYRSGITMVKSPKGTGKTEALRALIRKIDEGNIPRGIAKKDHPQSILLIGHRRSLLKEAANKLGLRYYLDTNPNDEIAEENTALLQPPVSNKLQERNDSNVALEIGSSQNAKKTKPSRDKRRDLAICLDSLHHIAEKHLEYLGNRKFKSVAPKPYDIVIIDESEQVFSHLLSETIRSRVGIDRAFRAIEFEIRKAKSVYALDADLGLITAHALKALRPDLWHNDCRIIYNKPLDKIERRQMNVYRDKKDLQNRLLEAIRENKRCFVATNSKKTANTLSELINKEFNSTIKMRVITSDNSQNPDERAFVENIRNEFLKTQVLICSPSLGTGIDISFLDGRCEVDEVIGFFYSFVNTHTDIDQQLARVRNPAAVSVWFDGARFNYETNFDVVRRGLAVANFVPNAVSDKLDDGGNVTINYDHPLLLIATHVTVAQRASKRDLITLFEKLRKANNWDIVYVDKLPKVKIDTKWKDATLTVKERRVEGILKAEDLDDNEFLELAIRKREGASLSKEENFAVERGGLQRAYKVKITRQLIEMDDGGRLRQRIELFQKVFKPSVGLESLVSATEQGLNNREIFKYQPEWVLIFMVLVSVGFFEESHFVTDKHIKANELGDFVQFCQKNKIILEEILGVALRGDVATNPIRQLNVFMGRVGLRLKSARRRKVAGKANFEYCLDPKRLREMAKLSKSYQPIESVIYSLKKQ